VYLAVIASEAKQATLASLLLHGLLRCARNDDPVFQGAGDGIEKLRRTGYSAFAEYDGLGRHESIPSESCAHARHVSLLTAAR
jgi:hypothetical protein